MLKVEKNLRHTVRDERGVCGVRTVLRARAHTLHSHCTQRPDRHTIGVLMKGVCQQPR